MKAKGRTRPLDILGGPGVGPWLERLLDLGYPGSFGASCNFDVRPLPLRPGPTTQWRDLTLSVAASEHKVRNLALRIEDGTRSVCYSGDGAPTEATRALFHGTDLLIHECYGAQHARPGHACLSELLILAAETKVSRLALVHLAEEQAPQIHAMVANYKGPTSLSLPSPGDKLTW